jgi:hypothetical protein
MDSDVIISQLADLSAEDLQKTVDHVFTAPPKKGGLAGDARRATVSKALAEMPVDERKNVVSGTLAKMPARERAAVVRSALPRPSRNIWYLLIGGLIGIAAFGMASGLALTLADKTSQASWAIVTAVVGGLVGLIAPSPIAPSDDSGS